MKTLSKLICLLVLAITLKPCAIAAQNTSLKTDSAHRLLDTVLTFTRHNSLYRNNVDWKKVEDSVRLTAANAVTVKDALPAIRLLYKLLGDHHGFITYGNRSYSWRGNDKPIDPSTHQELLKKIKTGYTLTACILENGYGYLLVPDNNPTHFGDVNKIAQQIQDSLTKLSPQKLKGLIIDLRLNPGGDMSAMVGGLLTLFEPGKLGSFVFPITNQKEAWGVKNNIVYDGADTTCTLKQPGQNLNNLKVAVLTGPYTRSSGEATAISFKGRKNTWFIGESTGGYTTSNNSFQFTNEIGFFLATSVEADRNGHLYLDKVQPDQEIIGGDNFDDLKNDSKVIAGLKWLKEKN